MFGRVAWMGILTGVLAVGCNDGDDRVRERGSTGEAAGAAGADTSAGGDSNHGGDNGAGTTSGGGAGTATGGGAGTATGGGEAGAGGTGEGPTTLSIEEFVQQYAAATCDKHQTCTGTEAQPVAQFCFDTPTDGLSCTAVHMLCWGQPFSDTLVTAVEEGRLVFNGDAARACVEAIEAMSCQECFPRDTGGVSLCPSMVEARVAIGEPCADNYECTSGSCERIAVPGEGLCGPMPGPGEACPFGNCPDGYSCGYSGNATAVCSKRRGLGETCSQFGPACESPYVCGSSLETGIGQCQSANGVCDRVSD